MTSRLTLEEAARELRTTRRWLLEWLRAHPVDPAGEAYYTPVGRNKVFYQADIARIDRALRGEVKCRSSSGRRGKAKRRISKSGDHTLESALKLAAELTNDPSLLSSSGGSRNASNSTASTPRPRLKLIQGSQPS